MVIVVKRVVSVRIGVVVGLLVLHLSIVLILLILVLIVEILVGFGRRIRIHLPEMSHARAIAGMMS